MSFKSLFTCLALSFCAPVGPIMANTSTACDQAAITAAFQAHIPSNVMRAVTRLETGRSKGGKLTPWPWTVNMEGEGRWFASKDEAKAYVIQHYQAGKRSFDVGCFQINYRWHGGAFRSIEDMFDPDKNAAYAADFLKTLYREFGNWDDAVGAYHSRTDVYADRYLAKYQRIAAALPGPPSRNRFPLLTAGGGVGANGSLVPTSTKGATPLLTPAQP